MREVPRNIDYDMTNQQAEALKGTVLLPSEIRRKLLQRYASDHGADALVRLFSEFIGLANSVVANNREAAEMILIAEGGLAPEDAEQANLPTVFGALCGITLANLVPQEKICGGCAFRKGTWANQSPITTCDADWCDESEQFMCHENLDESGAPKHICRGFALRECQHAASASERTTSLRERGDA